MRSRIDRSIAYSPRSARATHRTSLLSSMVYADRHLARVAVAIFRHSRIALTMEVYTQVRDKTTVDALKRLSEWLDTPGESGQLKEL